MSGLCGTNQPVRTVQVPGQLDKNTGLLNRLDEALKAHEARIKPILSPEGSDCPPPEKVPTPILCDVATVILGLNERLAGAVEYLEEMTRRVEV